MSKIAKFRYFLKGRIDPDTILDCLLAKAILSKEEVDEVKSRSTIWGKNDGLLDYIIEKDNGEGFIDALRDANQQHLANYLLNDGVRSRNNILEDWPLEETHVKKVNVNYGVLKDNIDMRKGLGDKLFARKVLSLRQLQLIYSKATDSEKNEVFLDHLRRGSISDYENTIQSLRDFNQGHIAEILEKDCVVLPVHAVLQEPSAEVRLDGRITLDGAEPDDAVRILEMVKDKITAVKIGQSIVLYYYFESLQSWQEMKSALIEDGTLKRYIEELCKRADSQTDVIITKIYVKYDDLENINKYFAIKAMHDSVSEFIVRTCQMVPKSNTNVFETMCFQASVPLREFKIVCGSCAEFSIRPLHSCIGDIDIFQFSPNFIAFTDKQLVLPYDVRHIADAIECFLMEPYVDYPAFVQLRRLGEMRYNWDSKTYEFIQEKVEKFLTSTEIQENPKCKYETWCNTGPATKMTETRPHSADCPKSRRLPNSLSFDFVKSVWCPQWPNEAKHWPSRQRTYGWPTPAIIHEIVQNGCHAVFSKHPACRDDKGQWRLSFSFAEVILLQSWTPVQQIVYHMLRFFAKKELMKKYCPKEDEVLCTYHFKTLMLWSSEEMSPEWWNSLSVIELCCHFLKKLANWLEETRCPNYFIPQANLFHEHFNRKIVDETAKKVIYFCDSDILRLWFVEHYIQPNFHDNYDVLICVHWHMKNIRKAMKADKPQAIDIYVALRFQHLVRHVNDTVTEGFALVSVDLDKYALRIGSLYEDELSCFPFLDIESCYWLYESMLRILHAIHLLDCKEMHGDSEWFVEVIRQVSFKPKHFRSKHHILPRPLNKEVDYRSHLYFLKAQDLMENLTGSNDDLGFQVVAEISKGLLRKALECQDSKTNTIAKATLSYMAALHFAASEYQTVIDLCSRVIMVERHGEDDTETLNAGCLLYIEDISKIIGFYLIFRKIKDASLHYTRRQFFLDLRLTAEVFAHYLTISLIERTGEGFRPNEISQSPTFPLDAILMTITNRNSSKIPKKRKNVLCVYQRTDPMNKSEAPNDRCLPNEDDIIQLLMEFSFEHMTSFYNAICKDCDISCNTLDCYRAAYLYQCRKYFEALHLCERILKEPNLRSELMEFAFANAIVVPPLDSYFDRDIQCLLGLHTLVCYLSPSNEELGGKDVCVMSTFQHYFAQQIYSGKKPLSYVLIQRYSLMSHYFLGRHFLARYLKVRCLIDCNHSLSEVMFEFKKLKACLPFEHIIRCFLEHKLWQLQKDDDAQ